MALLILAKTDGTGSPSPAYYRTFNTTGVLRGNVMDMNTSGQFGIAGSRAVGVGGNADAVIVRCDNTGAPDWNGNLGGTYAQSMNGVHIDGSGGLYATGQHLQSGIGQNNILIYGNGWTRARGNIYGTAWGSDIATDSSGNVYVVGRMTNSSSNQTGSFLKYNSTGTLQWHKRLGASGGGEMLNGIMIDSSDNIYVAGYTSTNSVATITKFDSNGAALWQRKLDHTTPTYVVTYNQVGTDASGNIYCVGNTQYSGGNGRNALIVKYNSSGVYQWHHTLKGPVPNQTDSFTSIAFDASGNVFASGSTGQDDKALYVKYDSSGNLLWQTTIERAGTVKSNGLGWRNNVLYSLIYSAHIAGAHLFKVPQVVAGSETLGDFTVNTSTLTETSIPLTDSAGSVSITDTTSMTDQGTPGAFSLTITDDTTYWL